MLRTDTTNDYSTGSLWQDGGNPVMIDIKHFFGLSKEPFAQNIKLDDLYMLPGLEPLLQRFEFTVKTRAYSVITGEVGSGKSTSLRLACSRVPQ